jgi:hypothetical protein
MINYTFLRLIFGAAALVGSNERFVVLTPGFPIAVPNTGCALVLGRAGAERGYLLRSATVTYFENGGEGRTAKAVFHQDGTFGTIISGLTPGATYQVLVEVVDSSSVEYRTRIRSTTVKAR